MGDGMDETTTSSRVVTCPGRSVHSVLRVIPLHNLHDIPNIALDPISRKSVPELEFTARAGGNDYIRLDLPDLSRLSVKYPKGGFGMQETVWAQQIREFRT